MTVNHFVNERQTVMLAADVNSYSVTTVNLAVEMAASTNTHLRCLFIEDEDLLQVAGLPCTSEISLTTGHERPTSIDQMQRSMRSLAQQFKQTLQLEAQALRIAWSFDTVRGRVRDISFEPGPDVTYTILGQPVSHQSQPGRIHGPRKILLVGNDSPHQKYALEMLLRRFAHQPIEVTLVADNKSTEVLSAIMQRTEANEQVKTLTELNRHQLDDLLNKAGTSFDCAIISKHGESVESLRILKMLRCPVILVA
jgi:hypothetical protein